ncbi:MAG: M28 family metallopeptidase [Anaerolineae bacterium]
MTSRLALRAAVVLLSLIILGAWGWPGWAGQPAGGEFDPRIAGWMNRITSAQLLEQVAKLSGEREIAVGGQPIRLRTRYSGTQEATLAAEYLRDYYAGLGLETELWPYGTAGWVNVVAVQAGWRNPEEVYILCAHYDATSTTPLTDAPGADDNASGVSAVMAAAQVLAGQAFAHTIRYVHFSGEEQGLWGSSAYAHQSALLGEHIAGVINLDMLGWEGDGRPDFDVHAGAPGSASAALGDRLAGLVMSYQLPISVEVRLGPRAMGWSDHAPFWHEGYPAVLLIEDEEDFNPHYHTPQDKVGDLAPEYFTAGARAAVGLLAALAEPLAEPLPTPVPLPTPTPWPAPECPDHLANGGFEEWPTGARWTQASSRGYMLVSDRRPHAGAWGAWLSQTDGVLDLLCQPIAVPKDAGSPTLWFWWEMWTDEVMHSFDRLEVRFYPAGQPRYQLLQTLDDSALQHLWRLAVVPVDALRGQSGQLCFAGESDSSRHTHFFLDDVQLTWCGGNAGVWLPLLHR